MENMKSTIDKDEKIKIILFFNRNGECYWNEISFSINNEIYSVNPFYFGLHFYISISNSFIQLNEQLISIMKWVLSCFISTTKLILIELKMNKTHVLELKTLNCQIFSKTIWKMKCECEIIRNETKVKSRSWKWRELKKKMEWNIIWKTKTENKWNDMNWIVVYWMNWNDCYLWCTLKISLCLSWNWDVFKKNEKKQSRMNRHSTHT